MRTPTISIGQNMLATCWYLDNPKHEESEFSKPLRLLICCINNMRFLPWHVIVDLNLETAACAVTMSALWIMRKLNIFLRGVISWKLSNQQEGSTLSQKFFRFSGTFRWIWFELIYIIEPKNPILLSIEPKLDFQLPSLHRRAPI